MFTALETAKEYSPLNKPDLSPFTEGTDDRTVLDFSDLAAHPHWGRTGCHEQVPAVPVNSVRVVCEEHEGVKKTSQQ